MVRSGLHGDSRSRSQTVLEIEFITYISVKLKFILDWNSHAPGPGEETGLGSLIVTGAVGVGTVKSLRGRPQTVLGFFASILFYMFPK